VTVSVEVNGFDFIPVVKDVNLGGAWPPSEEEIKGFSKFTDIIKNVEQIHSVIFSRKISLLGMLGGDGRVFISGDNNIGICIDRAVAVGASEISSDALEEKLVNYVNNLKKQENFNKINNNLLAVDAGMYILGALKSALD